MNDAQAINTKNDAALPPAIPGELNANVQAATDGFLFAGANAANNGDGGEIYAVSDANPNPATRRASAGVHLYYHRSTSRNKSTWPACSHQFAPRIITM